MCESRVAHMPRNKGNKGGGVAGAAGTAGRDSGGAGDRLRQRRLPHPLLVHARPVGGRFRAVPGGWIPCHPGDNGRSLRPADFRGIKTFHRDSTTTLDGVLFELPSTLIGERVVLRYDPVLPPSNRRLFVHHGGRHVGEARLVDSYANARVRRADLRLDPAGDDDNDAAGATAPRPGMANSAHVHPVLLIDEAHLLSTEILPEIRFHQFPRRFLQRADRHPLRFGNLTRKFGLPVLEGLASSISVDTLSCAPRRAISSNTYPGPCTSMSLSLIFSMCVLLSIRGSNPGFAPAGAQRLSTAHDKLGIAGVARWARRPVPLSAGGYRPMRQLLRTGVALALALTATIATAQQLPVKVNIRSTGWGEDRAGRRVGGGSRA